MMMKFLAIALTLMIPPLSAMGQELHLKAHVTCRGPRIAFGMLVEEGESAPFADRRVGEAPRPGEAMSVSRARLQRRLWDWGWRGRLVGPGKIMAKTPSVDLSTAPIREDVIARLDSMLGRDGLHLSGEIKGWSDRIRLSNPHIHWSLDLRGKRRFRNRSAELRIEDSAGFGVAALLRFHCRMPVAVAVAKRDLAEGETLGAWEMQERDAFLIDGTPLGEEELRAAVCSRAVKKGCPLTDRNLETGLLVRAGREVEIMLRRGPVTVRMMGVAQADGQLGDRIYVRPLDGGPSRRYRVVGSGRVSPSYTKPEGETS